MTQDQWIIALFKGVIVANEITIIAFIVTYTMYAQWWRNVIGRSVVILDALLGLAFLPSVISLFFDFNRLTSRVAAWIDIALFAGIAGMLAWRCVIWTRIHRRKQEEPDE